MHSHDTFVLILTGGVTIQLGVNDLNTANVPVFTKEVFNLRQHGNECVPHLYPHRQAVCSQEWRSPYSYPLDFVFSKRNVS